MRKGKRYGIFKYFFHQFFVLVGYHKPKRVRWHDRKIFPARFLVRVFRRQHGRTQLPRPVSKCTRDYLGCALPFRILGAFYLDGRLPKA